MLATAQPAKTGTKTAGKSTSTTAKAQKPDLQAIFNKFFELSDGDSADVVLKSKLGADICKADNTSKYCTYAAAWASTYDEKYEHALELIQELLKDYPNWAEVYFLYAQYLDYKEEPGAVEQAQKAVEMNPKLIYPVFFLATHYEEQENFKLSLQYYNMLEKLAPNHRSLYYNRAHVKGELGDLQGAIADYTIVLEKNPKHFRALFNRANTYLSLENWSKAETDFTAFIQMIPNNANAFYSRGYARYRQSKAAECCADMKKAGELGHKDAAAYAAANCQ